jgi:predicted transposase YbfD/YdcC
MVTAERRIGTDVTTETRYYLSSRAAGAAAFGQAVRTHWGIENRLHWVLDVTFHEDDHRTRTGHSAENFAVLRHLALNLLRRNTAVRGSIATKRFKAALTEQYLARLIAQ